MSYRRELQVGVLFLVGIVLLFVFTVTLNQFDLFKESHTYIVFFDKDVGGLKKGDPVRVSGMEAGSVLVTKLVNQDKIKVTLKLWVPLKLYEDYHIMIAESSMLGGNFVSIYQGTPSKPLLPTDQYGQYKDLHGELSSPGLEVLGNVASMVKDDVQRVFSELTTIMTKISRGEGSLGKLVNDDVLYNNLKETSESLKKITKHIEEGKGILGRVIFDEKLSDDLSQAGNAATRILSPVVQTQVFVGVAPTYFAKSKETITKAYLKIYPNPYRYFLLGGSFISLDSDGVVNFEDKQNHNWNQRFVKPDLLLAYSFPFADPQFTFRTGLIEGKLGAGMDFDLPVTATGICPISISLEGRDAYTNVLKERIDENLRGGMFRAYATVKLSQYFQVYLGSSRLFNRDAEFMGGISFSYPDTDIKNFVVLMGLARP